MMKLLTDPQSLLTNGTQCADAYMSIGQLLGRSETELRSSHMGFGLSVSFFIPLLFIKIVKSLTTREFSYYI
jgi:hypothetical protein